jgi:hypothetical protein
VTQLRTLDEHCPRYVHVENEEVPWEARLAFSFVSDVIRLMDVDPIRDAPGTRTIDRIKTAIVNNLPKCRAEWWMKVGTCCLDNRWVRVSLAGTLTVLAMRGAGAVQIGKATYEPRAGQLMLTMKDGTNVTMKAGTGVEQWGP